MPNTAAHPVASTNGGTRLSYSRSRLLPRSSRRLRPSASIDHSPSATVGMPIPPAASRLTSSASTAAPKAVAARGSLRHSGAPRSTAATQLAPRIIQRKNRSPSNGFKRPSTATNAQPPNPANPISQPSRRGGPSISSSSASSGTSSEVVRRESLPARPVFALCSVRAPGPRTVQTPKASAATSASKAQKPAVAHTSRNKLCGSRISSLDCGSLYLK